MIENSPAQGLALQPFSLGSMCINNKQGCRLGELISILEILCGGNPKTGNNVIYSSCHYIPLVGAGKGAVRTVDYNKQQAQFAEDGIYGSTIKRFTDLGHSQGVI